MSARPKAAKDANDALKARGAAALKARVDAAPLAEVAKPEPTEADALRAEWLAALGRSTLRADELRALDIRPRRPLLADWLCEADQGFIYAPRGVGKTWFALHLAVTLAEGGAMGEWRAPEPVPVLYVDGEMPPDLLRQREQGLSRTADGMLSILNHGVLFDRAERAMNIATPAVQDALTELCVARLIKVLVLDNLSTLAVGMAENDNDEWEKVNGWLLGLRRRGIAVVIVHHAGRNGMMRGASRREDAAFWTISLTGDGATETGAKFVSSFSKPSRNTQDRVPAMEWHYTTAATGRVSIGHRRANPGDTLRRLVGEGVTSCSDLAEEMGITKGAVSKLAKRAGLVKAGRDYALAGGTGDGNEEGEK